MIQSVIEKAGIPTVGISLLKEVTKAVKPPRTLFVDRPLGFPLGLPNHPTLQKRIICAALGLISARRKPPFIEDFVEASDQLEYRSSSNAAGVESPDQGKELL